MEYDRIPDRELRAYCEQCDRKFEAGTISPTEYLLAVERIERTGYVIPKHMQERADRIEQQLTGKGVNNFFEIAEKQRQAYAVDEAILAQITDLESKLRKGKEFYDRERRAA